MSSIKGINHPAPWLHGKSEKNDVIEGILIGKQETNNLNKKNNDSDHRPDKMMGKLARLAANTTIVGVKSRAHDAITLLEPFVNQTSPVREIDRIRILNTVNGL